MPLTRDRIFDPKGIINNLIVVLFVWISCFGFSQDTSFFYPTLVTTQDDELEKEIQDDYFEALDEAKNQYKGKQFKALRETHGKRRDAFLDLLNNGKLIYSGELHAHVQKVMDEVVANSPTNKRVRVFLVRSESVNAFNMGGGAIFVHLGLLQRLTCDSELAFVLGHELGHDHLNHYHEKTVESSELVVNDSINKRIKEIQRLEYGRVSELNELLIPWLLSSKAKSRECEYAADQFGLECLENTSYDKSSFVNVFTILDESDEELDTTRFDFEKLLYLDQIDNDFKRALSFNTQSSLGSFTIKKDTLEDLLRTHPFGMERMEELAKQLGTDVTKSEKETHQEYVKVQYLSEYETIANALRECNMGRAVFHSLNRVKSNPDDAFAQKVLSLSFAYFAYAKKNRILGKVIDNNSHHNSENFNELLLFIRQLSPEQCLQISNALLSNSKSDEYISYPAKAIQNAYLKKFEDFKIQYDRLSMDESNSYLETIFQSIFEASNLRN